MNIQIIGGIADYNFDSVGDAIKRMNQWREDGLASERELSAFVIQLFHQIPEQVYNDIISES